MCSLKVQFMAPLSRLISISGAESTVRALPAILEAQSPSAALAAAPMPRAARGAIWIVASMLVAWIAALAVIEVDRVVTAAGRVVSKSSVMVVQPLETAIVRSIVVHEGQRVRSGDMLARLDPTFSAADVGALKIQTTSLEAEVSRLQAEVDDRQFQTAGLDPPQLLQAAIYTQRRSELASKQESYHQKIEGLKATVERSVADAVALAERLAVAQNVESMRKRLEEMQFGSRLNLLGAIDNRLEIERNLSNARKTGETAKTDLAAMMAERDAFVQNWRVQAAQALTEATRKLSDAREALNKSLLRREFVQLRADRDATVLTVAKVSEGSVMQSGEQLITLVPADAELEVESNISGRDYGFLHLGDPVAIKFDTFPFSQYGLATGTVRVISPDSFTTADQLVGRTGAMPIAQNSTEPFYRSRISIDSIALHGVPPDFRIAAGMPVSTEIKVGTHTLLAYLLGRVLPVMSEGMREP
jgi:HlyD family secretion protein